MDVTAFLTRTSHALRGIDEDAPAFGSDEAVYWLNLLNRKKDELYQDVTKNWRNIYEVRSLGIVSASTAPSFDLDDDFLCLSGDENSTEGFGGGVYIIQTDGNRIDINVINPEERSPQVRSAFVAGFEPQTLYITDEIKATENIIGGTLYAPAYYMPADLTAAGDTLPFLDPNWACMAVAAEIAFGDITYEDKAPDLNSKANALYELMVRKNRGQLHNNPKKIKTQVKRIRSPRFS